MDLFDLEGTIPRAEQQAGWLGSIWNERAACADKPALILWGHKDISRRRNELERWQCAPSRTELHEFAGCSYFPAEETSQRVFTPLREFLGKT